MSSLKVIPLSKNPPVYTNEPKPQLEKGLSMLSQTGIIKGSLMPHLGPFPLSQDQKEAPKEKRSRKQAKTASTFK